MKKVLSEKDLMEKTLTEKDIERYEELVALIKDWDEKANDNKDNRHKLSSSQRKDWYDELLKLELKMLDALRWGVF